MRMEYLCDLHAGAAACAFDTCTGIIHVIWMPILAHDAMQKEGDTGMCACHATYKLLAV